MVYIVPDNILILTELQKVLHIVSDNLILTELQKVVAVAQSNYHFTKVLFITNKIICSMSWIYKRYVEGICAKFLM